MSGNQWCDVDDHGLKVCSPKLEYFYDDGRIANNPNLSGYGVRTGEYTRTGESQAAGRFANTGVASFTTPDGWEDALLILSALAER